MIHETGATFRHTLKLCLFTGEEQGLVGSRALASQYAEEGVDGGGLPGGGPKDIARAGPRIGQSHSGCKSQHVVPWYRYLYHGK